MNNDARLLKQLDEAQHTPERIGVAVQIGWEGSSGCVAPLLAKLKEWPSKWPEGRAIAACCVALEMIGEASAADELGAWLQECPDEQVWDVCHAIGRLRGIDPVVPAGADVQALRQVWLDACAAPQAPTLKDIQEQGDALRFVVDSGSSRIRIDFDPPPLGTSNWARWNRSVFVNGTRLYGMGSTCGTCETLLFLAGWPKERAFELSRELSATMQNEVLLNADWLQRWAPLLTGLQTGHYFSAKLRLPVERVDAAEESWMTRRLEFRAQDDDDDDDDGLTAGWPGTPHYQGPRFARCAKESAESPSTYWVVLPSQELGALDESRVEHYMARIQAGESPCALALGWMEDRYVQARWDERIVVLTLLDGHHKMEAYARLGRPADVISLFHLDNTWGPREDPSAPLRSALRQLNP